MTADWFWAPLAEHIWHTRDGLHVLCLCDLGADHYGAGMRPPLVVDTPDIATYPGGDQ